MCAPAQRPQAAGGVSSSPGSLSAERPRSPCAPDTAQTDSQICHGHTNKTTRLKIAYGLYHFFLCSSILTSKYWTGEGVIKVQAQGRMALGSLTVPWKVFSMLRKLNSDDFMFLKFENPSMGSKVMSSFLKWQFF